jgi:hypothetical protein
MYENDSTNEDLGTYEMDMYDVADMMMDMELPTFLISKKF